MGIDPMAQNWYAGLVALNQSWMPVINAFGQFETQGVPVSWDGPPMLPLKQAFMDLAEAGQPIIQWYVTNGYRFQPAYVAGFDAYATDFARIGPILAGKHGLMTQEDIDSFVANYSYLFNEINTYCDPMNEGLGPIQ